MGEGIERIVPKEMRENNGLLIEHKARYKFASEYVEGKVLDLACGVGYGSEILLAMGEGIEKIIGLDQDSDSIEYAREHYDCPWTEFKVETATDLNLVNDYGQFDSIVSMETVEHIREDFKFISNLNNLLKEKGKLVISTPFGAGRKASCSNPYHYRQYTKQEFIDLLATSFSNIEVYHQCQEKIELPQADKKYYLMVAVCQK